MSDDPFAPKIDPNADPFAPKAQSNDVFAPRDAESANAAPSDAPVELAETESSSDATSDSDVEEQAKALIVYVKEMQKQGVSQDDAVKTLVEKGFPEAESRSIVENVYSTEVESGGRSGVVSLVIGIILLAAGGLATFFAVGNRIWYGAILVGVFEIFRGIINMIRGK